jgi:PBP1b-binding outer membrane lipoprotein LpoB
VSYPPKGAPTIKRIALIAVPAAIVALAGCGSHSAPPTAPAAAAQNSTAPSPSPTVNYQQQYLTDVAPYNAAINALNPNAGSVTDPTVQAVATASLTFSRVLLQQSWPASAESDVHALAVAAAKVSADLSSDTLFAANGASDGATATADAQTARADLGLPAATESPTG